MFLNRHRSGVFEISSSQKILERFQIILSTKALEHTKRVGMYPSFDKYGKWTFGEGTFYKGPPPN